jgi:HAD superfamily hydrolase (TIGR01549 family)
MLTRLKRNCDDDMSIDPNRYKTLVFDCDGVILNSNRVKTEAFRSVALPYGSEAAEKLVEFHVANGGISRYRKFEYFLDNIVPDLKESKALDQLLDAFSAEVVKGLMVCEVASGLEEMRRKLSSQRWLVVSGGDQDELRRVFSLRDLERHFDGGVFGSPDDKADILARELEVGNIRDPALYIGDSKYDYAAAKANELDFLFVSDWTDIKEWRDFVKTQNLGYTQSISDILGSEDLCWIEDRDKTNH